MAGLAAVFGAGGGTSSYQEMHQADVIIAWGSNARSAHPIFFHHVLRGVRNGASLVAVDPRRSDTARFADLWLGIDVGTDIPLANTVAHQILEQGWENREFIGRATVGFEKFAESVQEWTLERGSEVTGVPAEAIAELARVYATADRAQLCWTLGITEHHNATDNVLALINLALLTGHVGRFGSGLVPVRGQNNVQGGGDMGALPNKLTGFQDLTDPEVRARFERVWGAAIPPQPGRHLTQMFEGMEEGKVKTAYALGENPATSEADVSRAQQLLSELDTLIVQDLFLTKTAELATVVFPAAADWAESDGTVTSSERRVQRVRAAVSPPGQARPDRWILSALAARLGLDWGFPTAEELWDELRGLSPMHAGMSYARLEQHGGLQWPCYDEDHPGEMFLHSRLWQDPIEGPLAPFHPTPHSPPVDTLTSDYPIRLTTGRHLDSYNTGVQSGRFRSPRRTGLSIDLDPFDARQLQVGNGERVRVISRRGEIEVLARIEEGLRPGLAFMTFHYPDAADVNQLTIEAWDPKSGTAEFKATAVRVEKV